MKRLLVLFLALATALQAAVPLKDPRITGTNSQVASGTFAVKSGATLAIEAGAFFTLAAALPLNYGGTGAALADPGADRIMFWDDSAGAVDWLSLGSQLSISGTTLNVSAAPVDATYITQTSNATLTAEQALSGLATGLVQVTTATGVLSSVTTSAGVSGLLSDETGSGALVFGTSPTITTPTISGAVTWPTGVRQTFAPDATNAGLNVGSVAGDPSTPSNGDLWYDSTANELTARINGVNVPMGGGGIGGSTGSTDNVVLRADGTGGATMQGGGVVTLSDTGQFTFPAGVKQTFAPDSTTAGFNVGSVAGDPSTPANGDLWYDSTANELTARINGASVALGAGGGGGIGGSTGSTDNRLLRADGTGGSTLQSSNVTLADSGTAFQFSGPAGLTAGSGNDNVTLTPQGQGTNVLVNGFRIGSAASSEPQAVAKIYGASFGETELLIYRDGGNSYGPQIKFFKVRGSRLSPSYVSSGDQLGYITAGSYDGGTREDRTRMEFLAAQTWSSGSNGTEIVFWTTPNGSTSTASRFAIRHSGQIGVLTNISSTSTSTGSLVVSGGTGIAGNTYVGGLLNMAGDIQADKTVTAGGTTGAQTINKNAGSVNFAASATSLVVTNSRVTANSIIIATVATNDTTMKSVQVVAGSGSFTIYGDAAATAETRVNFLVVN